MPKTKAIDNKIWGIAWPAMLSNLSIPLLGLVDAAILGHLDSSRFLGAVAIGGALLSFLYWGFGFLRMGTTGLVARATGAGEEGEALLVLGRSIILALLLATAVIILHPLWLGVGFTLMAPSDAVLPLAQSYTSIRIASAPAVLVVYAIIGWCIGRQDTRWPLLIVVTQNVANILLDLLLILGMGLQSDGAAIATVIAEYLGCAVALTALLRARPQIHWHSWWPKLLLWRQYRTLLRSNFDLFVRTICLLGSFAFFTAAGDKLGPQVLAANALLLQLLMLASYAMDAFAFAAEGLSGQALGAGDRDDFRNIVRRCTLWCTSCALLLSTLFLLGRSPLISVLTNIEALRTVLQTYYFWLVLMPLAAGPSYLLDGIFIGAGRTRQMMLTMLFSACLVYLPVWYLTRAWGNHGLWLAFLAFNASRGATLYLSYRGLKRELSGT